MSSETTERELVQIPQYTFDKIYIGVAAPVIWRPCAGKRFARA